MTDAEVLLRFVTIAAVGGSIATAIHHLLRRAPIWSGLAVAAVVGALAGMVIRQDTGSGPRHSFETSMALYLGAWSVGMMATVAGARVLAHLKLPVAVIGLVLMPVFLLSYWMAFLAGMVLFF